MTFKLCAIQILSGFLCLYAMETPPEHLFASSWIFERSSDGVTESELAEFDKLLTDYSPDKLARMRAIVCKCRNLRNEWIAYTEPRDTARDGQILSISKHMGYVLLMGAIKSNVPQVVKLLCAVLENDLREGLRDKVFVINEKEEQVECFIENQQLILLTMEAVAKPKEIIAILLDAGLDPLIHGQILTLNPQDTGYAYYLNIAQDKLRELAIEQ